jgi:hypothetical protein
MDIYSSFSVGARKLSGELGYMVYDKNNLKVLPRVQYDNNPNEDFGQFTGNKTESVAVGVNSSYKIGERTTIYMRPEVSYSFGDSQKNYLLENALVRDRILFNQDQAIVQLSGSVSGSSSDNMSSRISVRPFYQIQLLKWLFTRVDVEAGYNFNNERSSFALGHKLSFTVAEKPWWGAAVISSFPIAEDGKPQYSGSYFWTGRCMPEIHKDLFIEGGIWVGRDAYEGKPFGETAAAFSLKLKFGRPENRWWP